MKRRSSRWGGPAGRAGPRNATASESSATRRAAISEHPYHMASGRNRPETRSGAQHLSRPGGPSDCPSSTARHDNAARTRLLRRDGTSNGPHRQSTADWNTRAAAPPPLLPALQQPHSSRLLEAGGPRPHSGPRVRSAGIVTAVSSFSPHQSASGGTRDGSQPSTDSASASVPSARVQRLPRFLPKHD